VKANFGLFSFAIFSQNIFGFVGLALWLFLALAILP
jgi:hypothetical protein